MDPEDKSTHDHTDFKKMNSLYLKFLAMTLGVNDSERQFVLKPFCFVLDHQTPFVYQIFVHYGIVICSVAGSQPSFRCEAFTGDCLGTGST